MSVQRGAVMSDETKGTPEMKFDPDELSTEEARREHRRQLARASNEALIEDEHAVLTDDERKALDDAVSKLMKESLDAVKDDAEKAGISPTQYAAGVRGMSVLDFNYAVSEIAARELFDDAGKQDAGIAYRKETIDAGYEKLAAEAGALSVDDFVTTKTVDAKRALGEEFGARCADEKHDLLAAYDNIVNDELRVAGSIGKVKGTGLTSVEYVAGLHGCSAEDYLEDRMRKAALVTGVDTSDPAIRFAMTDVVAQDVERDVAVSGRREMVSDAEIKKAMGDKYGMYPDGVGPESDKGFTVGTVGKLPAVEGEKTEDKAKTDVEGEKTEDKAKTDVEGEKTEDKAKTDVEGEKTDVEGEKTEDKAKTDAEGEAKDKSVLARIIDFVAGEDGAAEKLEKEMNEAFADFVENMGTSEQTSVQPAVEMDRRSVVVDSSHSMDDEPQFSA
jgi:hypothetical protein